MKHQNNEPNQRIAIAGPLVIGVLAGAFAVALLSPEKRKKIIASVQHLLDRTDAAFDTIEEAVTEVRREGKKLLPSAIEKIKKKSEHVGT